MALDSNNIWQYEESDPASPFSDLLNLLAASTSDVVEDLDARLAAREQAWTWTPALTLEPNWEWLDANADPVRFTVVNGVTFTTGGLLRRISGQTANLNANVSVTLGTWNAAALPTTPANMRMPYQYTQVRGTVKTGGLIYSQGSTLRVEPQATTTLTGGSTGEYVVIPASMWIKAV